MIIPNVEKIIHRTSKRGEFFTVFWVDGTKTTVKLMKGDTSDEYTAFLYVLGKKLFGNKGVAKEFIAEKKKVFEDELEHKKAEKDIDRKNQALQQFLDAESGKVMLLGSTIPVLYPPILESKNLFKRNKY